MNIHLLINILISSIMKRVTFDVVWRKGELDKVFNAIARYNETFRDKIVVVKTKEEKGGECGFTWLTISYVDDPRVLLWFGILLGRQGV